jgi:hypothetical protein
MTPILPYPETNDNLIYALSRQLNYENFRGLAEFSVSLAEEDF